MLFVYDVVPLMSFARVCVQQRQVVSSICCTQGGQRGSYVVAKKIVLQSL